MFERLFIISALLVLIIPATRSQGNDHYKIDSLKIKEGPAYIIAPYDIQVSTDTQEGLQTMPFSSIIIKDVRFDTSYFGAINSKKFLSVKGFHKLKFTDKTANILARILNDTVRYAFTPHSYNLLCFLKQLRITQMDSIPIEGKSKRLHSTATIVIDAYLMKDSTCYPVVRLDTVASSFDINEKDLTVLANVLNAFAKRVALTDTAKILKRKSYPLKEIRETYDQRFNKPIINDPVLISGVYKSYEEFINNNPSVREYEFNKEGILYTKIENNNWVPTRQAYGFCDGNRIWLNVNKVFYPLIRLGDTFEFLTGVKLVNEPTRGKNKKVYVYRSPGMSMGEYAAMTAAAGALMFLFNHYNNSPRFIYQLNLETGEFY